MKMLVDALVSIMVACDLPWLAGVAIALGLAMLLVWRYRLYRQKKRLQAFLDDEYVVQLNALYRSKWP